MRCCCQVLRLTTCGHYGHLVQAVVAAEIDEVEDAFLEAAVANAGAGFDELGAQSRIAADGTGHRLHIGAGGFLEGGDAVDRADALVADSAGLRSQPPGGGAGQEGWGFEDAIH